MANMKPSAPAAEILTPTKSEASYALNLPDCQPLSVVSLEGLRIVHAVYIGLPEACTNCGSKLFKRVKLGERYLWDEACGSTLVAIHLFFPKLRCIVCKSSMWVKVPWIYPHSRITSRSVKTILDLLAKEQSFAQIARDTGVNAAKIQQLFRTAYDEYEKTQGNKLARCTGADDFWIGRKSVFTIGGTEPGGALNAITKDRETATLRAAFAGFPNGSEVETLTLDHCDEIRKAAKDGDKDHAAPLPKAKPAINHFHYGKYVIQCFNDVLKQILKQVKANLKQADAKNRQLFLFEIKTQKQLAEETSNRVMKKVKSTKSTFTRLGYLLKKKPENLDEDGHRIVMFVLEKYPLLAEAWELKNFALNIRAKGKTTEQSMAEVELFKMQLGKLPKTKAGMEIVRCFEPLLTLLEKWGDAAFPTCKGSNNNLERIHSELRTFIKLGRGYSIPGLLSRERWRAFHKQTCRWPKEFANRKAMTLRQLGTQLEEDRHK